MRDLTVFHSKLVYRYCYDIICLFGRVVCGPGVRIFFVDSESALLSINDVHHLIEQEKCTRS